MPPLNPGEVGMEVRSCQNHMVCYSHNCFTALSSEQQIQNEIMGRTKCFSVWVEDGEEMMSCFSTERRRNSHVLLHVSFADRRLNRQSRAEESRRREEERQRKKISIRLAASVPFSLSGAGNLPTESNSRALTQLSSTHHFYSSHHCQYEPY